RWGKPVGFYLLDILSLRAFGASEFSARLPSVLAGLGLVLLTAALGAMLFDSRSGFYVGLFAATALQPVVYARTAVPDMLLSFFICLSLYGFVLWERTEAGGRGRVLALVLLYAGAALAFLVKGPLGALLPGITLAAYLVISRQTRELPRLGLWWGLPLFLALAAPWFIYMYRVHGPAYLEEFFLHRNLERYFTDRWEHPGPAYYYLPVLIAGSFPWTLALAGGAVRSLRGLIFPGVEPETLQKSWNSDLLAWCWLGVMLLFFSFSRSKLPNYVLPLYPAAALFSGCFLAGAEEAPGKRGAAALAAGTGVLALAALVFGAALLPQRTGMPRPQVLLALAPLGLVPAGAAAFLVRRRLALFTASAVAAMALMFALVSGVALPQADNFRAVRSFSRSRLGSLEHGERILCLQLWPPSLGFYTGGKLVRFDPYHDRWGDFAGQGGRWVLTRERSLPLLDSLMSFQPPAQTHRIGDRVLVRLQSGKTDD
ncbi:MAG: glycosyltransferase family 39 protein, partial [Candidatus Glassbacteria bacterium]|nr:glycosyltransferase family 39 protein [Candidatus Glassbacteria bacterium]